MIGSQAHYDMDEAKGIRHNKLKCMIGPSILCSDLSSLSEESQKLLSYGADYLHLDVMDGHFVPNLTFGHPVIKCLRNKLPEAILESHMMVSDPLKWVEAVADAGVNQYTFHIEACSTDTVTVRRVCRKIRESGMKVGLAIKPATPVTALQEFIELADLVLVMTVEPGFGGQAFMEDMMSKVRQLRSNNPGLNIEVDGGVGPKTIAACAEAGANWIVSGSAVTAAQDPQAVISCLRACTETYI